MIDCSLISSSVSLQIVKASVVNAYRLLGWGREIPKQRNYVVDAQKRNHVIVRLASSSGCSLNTPADKSR
jgi:hypothetical protein